MCHISWVPFHVSCVMCHVSSLKKIVLVFLLPQQKNIKHFSSYIASSPIMMIFLINSNITIVVQTYVLQTRRFFLFNVSPLSQPADGVLGNIVISSSRNNDLLLIPAFRKDEFTRTPAVGQWLSTSDISDVVSRVSQTSLFQLIFGPIVDECVIYIWVKFDVRVDIYMSK